VPPQQQPPYSDKSEEANTRNDGSQVENSAAEQPPERSSEKDEESGLDRRKGEDWDESVRRRREADLQALAETRKTLEKMQKMQMEQMRDQENLREATRRRDKELREEEERRRQEQHLMGKYVFMLHFDDELDAPEDNISGDSKMMLCHVVFDVYQPDACYSDLLLSLSTARRVEPCVT
jgi:hypothetical protein